MALLKILVFPDKRLRKIANEIVDINSKIKSLASSMLETMYENNGIGLAATQVNVHKRLIVVDVSEEKNKPIILINPHVNILSKEMVAYEEGCLSVPGFFEEVKRNATVEILYKDLSGEAKVMYPSGVESVVIQHEIDHLDGKVFVDYLSSLKREMIKKKLIKSQYKNTR